MISGIHHHSVVRLLIEVGQKVLQLRQNDDLKPCLKSREDYSVATTADTEASLLLKDGLSQLWPALTIISEEDNDVKDQYKDAVLIDPIDGSSEYLKGGAHFGILIARVVNGVPVAGYAYYPDPRIAAIYYTDPLDSCAYKQNVGNNGELSERRSRLMTSFSAVTRPSIAQVYTDVRDILPDISTPAYQAPSSTLAMLEGQVQLAAGPNTMMDWDLAAIDAIARKSDAVFINAVTGYPLLYGVQSADNRNFRQPRYIAGNQQLLRSLGLMFDV